MSTETATLEPPKTNLASSITQQLMAEMSTPDTSQVDVTPAIAPKTEDTPKVEGAPKEVEKSAEPPKPKTIDDFVGDEETEEPAKKDAATDDEEIPEEVKKQGEKSVSRWSDLKRKEKEFDKLAAENAELKAKVEKVVAPEVTKELDELRKVVAEKDRAIAAFAVTESDEYKHAVTEPLMRLEEQARAISDDPDMEEAIMAALEEPNLKARNKKLSDITDTLNAFQSAKLVRIVDDVDAVLSKGQEIRQKAIEARGEIERNKLAKTAEESEKDRAARLATADAIRKNIVKQMPFLADEDGDPLPEFKEVFEKGKMGITQEMSLRTQVFAGYAAQLVPHMAGIIEQRDGKIAELEASIKALRSANGEIGRPVSTPTPKGERKPLVQSIMEQLRAGE